MTKKNLKMILEKHLKWLGEEDGGERAVLDDENLNDKDLRGVNLDRASLNGASLDGASLDRASLDGASLNRASLNRASLDGASLNWASLDGASLNGIPQEIVNKICPLVCPESGAFIGWKKARGNTIVKLRIAETAKRSSATGRKCRCSEAVVLGIENIDGTPYAEKTVYSGYSASFAYTVGQTVRVDDFDENRLNECAPGIHFFITRQEAVDY